MSVLQEALRVAVLRVAVLRVARLCVARRLVARLPLAELRVAALRVARLLVAGNLVARLPLAALRVAALPVTARCVARLRVARLLVASLPVTWPLGAPQLLMNALRSISQLALNTMNTMNTRNTMNTPSDVHTASVAVYTRNSGSECDVCYVLCGNGHLPASGEGESMCYRQTVCHNRRWSVFNQVAGCMHVSRPPFKFCCCCCCDGYICAAHNG